MTKKKPETPLSLPKTKYLVIEYEPKNRYDDYSSSELLIHKFDDATFFCERNWTLFDMFVNRKSIDAYDKEWTFFIDGEQILSIEHPEFTKLIELTKIAKQKHLEAMHKVAEEAAAKRKKEAAARKRQQEAEELAIYEKVKAKLEAKGKV